MYQQQSDDEWGVAVKNHKNPENPRPLGGTGLLFSLAGRLSVAAIITKSGPGETTCFRGGKMQITVLVALRTSDDEDHGRVRERGGGSVTNRGNKDGRNVTHM